MPTNKDFKRIIRARMEKTGEAYTAARANLLNRPLAHPEAPSRPTIDLAKLAGMSDAAVEKATGCDWERWVFALDRAGAESWSHRAIADYVHEVYKVREWWTQTVAVGYERIKGLRAIGQRRTGGYEATKSKSIAAPAAAVFRAFAHARARRKWLPDTKVVVRRSTPNRSVRMTWEDGTSVEVWITSTANGKTTAQVQHRKLAGKEDADQRKQFWTERLSALSASVEPRA
jgi:uncharacterized protein YndB with AHSA1/START domain